MPQPMRIFFSGIMEAFDADIQKQLSDALKQPGDNPTMMALAEMLYVWIPLVRLGIHSRLTASMDLRMIF